MSALTSEQCVAQGDEWAMLSRRSEKWLWLVGVYTKWQIQKDIWTPDSGGLRTHGTSRFQSFLDQRHAISQGWNRAYRNSWVTKFNDFYLFALTERVVG